MNQLELRPQESKVFATVLCMSMSLDGYIADPNDFLGGETAGGRIEEAGSGAGCWRRLSEGGSR
jgi:hypothetical protein